MNEIRVAFFGAGRVSSDVTRLLQQRPGFRVAAAYCRNPRLAGKDLGEHAGVGPLGVVITADREAALQIPADIVAIATTSFLRELAGDIRAAVLAGRNVICTGEETAFPWAVDPALADELDRLARERGVTILGAGANPGFIFDALVVTLAGAAWDVKSIKVRRVVNVSQFSATILRRLGLGFTPEEFASGVAQQTIFGHIGFPQSIRLVGHALGYKITSIDKTIQPLIAETVHQLPHLSIPAGLTAGFVQRYLGMVEGQAWYEAELVGHADPPSAGFEPLDTIEIDGLHPVRVTIRPGCNAQLTSAAVIANSLRRVVESPPGFKTVADLPPAFPTL